MRLEIFFDCSSPWTWLCFERVQPLAEEFGVAIEWRPILVGGIFNAVNPGVEYFKAIQGMPPRKRDYFHKDLADWARATDLTIHFPPPGHPINSVKAMRACLVLESQAMLAPFARACFRAYFTDGRDISDDQVLTDICRDLGIDAAALLDRITTPEVKAALRANGDEVIARGAFGSPTMFLDGDDMYFGVDRLQMLRAAMERKAVGGKGRANGAPLQSEKTGGRFSR